MNIFCIIFGAVLIVTGVLLLAAVLYALRCEAKRKAVLRHGKR